MPPLQYRVLAAAMTLTWRNVADGAVAVLEVVRAEEVLDPALSGRAACERRMRIGRRML